MLKQGSWFGLSILFHILENSDMIPGQKMPGNIQEGLTTGLE
jgi:hypothetical protein